MRYLSFVCILLVAALCRGQSTSVDSALSAAREQSRHAIAWPVSLLVPEGIRQGYDMREYIASPIFGIFDSTHSPEEVMDEIYYTSEQYAHGNPACALLASAFGVIEHETIPLDMIGLTVNIPLTSEDHARFLLRWSHLPEHIYHTPEGDRDKLQHFFASAWLKNVLGMDWLARLAGSLVEIGEKLFVVGGSQDPRDLHANADGIRFGVRSEGNMEYSPSLELTPNP